MNGPREAALAVGVVLLLGLAFWQFTGVDLSTGSTQPDNVQTIDTEAAERGRLVAEGTGCLACHSIDGTPGTTGPTWKGLAGSNRPLQSGETVEADQSYLFNSITSPASQVVAGFNAVMPTTYGEQLSEQDIEDLIEYIKSLST